MATNGIKGWPERLWRIWDDVTERDRGFINVARRSVFDELITGEYTPLIELDSSNGLSALRDVETTTGDGAITNENGQHRLRTGATGGTAILATAERGRYQPGIEALPGIGIRRPSAPTGNVSWQAGYYDDNNGLIFGEDATGFFVKLRIAGTDQSKVYQSSMNGDRLDGTGLSGQTLDLTKPKILRMPHAWYFGGPGFMDAIEQDTDGNAYMVTMHRFGALVDKPFMEQPKLPVRAEVDSGGDATDFSLFVGGRQFGVIGRYNPNRRETAEERLGAATSTTTVPLVTFRKKTDAVNRGKSVKVSGIAVLSDVDAVAEIRLGGTISPTGNFGSVTDIPDSETAVEVDNTATSITEGQVIDKTLISGGTGNRSNLSGIRRIGLDIPDTAQVSLCVRTLNGTGTASAVFTVEEEW